MRSRNYATRVPGLSSVMGMRCPARPLGPHAAPRTFKAGLSSLALVMWCVCLPVDGQTPTPGPVERAGKAVDQAVQGLGEELAEVVLAARVRVALLEDLREAGLRVTVTVDGDAVRLTGEVPTLHDRVVAEGAARRVAGVKTVRNDVSVTATRPPEAVAGQTAHEVSRTLADALLEARVKVRLLDEIGQVAFSTEVDAVGGAVTLKGTVPDELRHALVLKVVRETSGVSSVMDRLTVKGK